MIGQDERAWVALHAESLCRRARAALGEVLIHRTAWGDVEASGWNGCPGAEALAITFALRDLAHPLATVHLVPWQPLHRPRPDPRAPLSLPPVLCTVTPWGLVLGSSECTASAEELRELDRVLWEGSARSEHERELDPAGSPLLPPGQCVLRHVVHPCYEELEIAEPGSAAMTPAALEDSPCGRMIRLLQVPEIGEPKASWIRPRSVPAAVSARALGLTTACELLSEVEAFDHELLATLRSALESPGKEETRAARERIEACARAGLAPAWELAERAAGWARVTLHRLLALPEESVVEELGTLHPFGDYTPKESPDTVLDYRPALADRVSALPPPELSFLPALIELLEKTRTEALRDPGCWVEGNLVLGAQPQEYHPSDAELLECELGARIRDAIEGASAAQIRAVLASAGCEARELEYGEIGFDHVDVMGSGRFTYASAPRRRVLRLSAQGNSSPPGGSSS